MSKRWIGTADEPRLLVKWRYAFIDSNSVVEPSPEAVYLDVGGKYAHGVIDHHHGLERACSATRLLTERPELVFEHLVAPWRAALRMRHATETVEVAATIVLHRVPDFDAIAAAFLARKLVETGGFPDCADELARYADRVDQGLEQVVAEEREVSLYAMILAITNVSPQLLGVDASSRDERCVELGCRAIELWASSAPESDRARVQTPLQLDRYGAEHLKAIAREIQEDDARFREAVAQNRVVALGTVQVPSQDRRTAPYTVHAAGIPAALQCWMHRFNLRRGFAGRQPSPLTVIAATPGRDARHAGNRRFIIALDKAIVGASLRGLGTALEIAEQRKRCEQNPRGIDGRAGSSRFADIPGIADPWYDGRGHEYGIVDSPIAGTVLEFDEVVGIVRQDFWEPEVESVSMRAYRLSIEGDLGMHSLSVDDKARSRLGKWREKANSHREDHPSQRTDWMFVRCDVHRGWGMQPIESFAELVCGHHSMRIDIAGYEFLVGPRGMIMLGPECRAVEDALAGQLCRIARLAQSLAQVDRHISESRASKSLKSLEVRRLMRDHAEQVATFFAGRARDLSADVLPVVSEIERQLDLDGRITGVGRLLGQLNDDAERGQSAQLNRLVFLVGLFSVLQTAVAIWPEFKDQAISDAVAFVVLIVISLLSFYPPSARLLARIPVLGDLLFADMSIRRS
jgi:hypothetical protein